MPVQTKIQMRRDTAANWTTNNPTLAAGEWGLETDTKMMKIGDGTTAWTSLAYELAPLLDEVIPTDPNGAYFTGSGLRMYGVAGNLASAPDSAALDITGDIDLRAKVAMDDWTPSLNTGLIAKNATSASQYSYQLGVLTTGYLYFQYSTDGTTQVTRSSTAITGITDGATKWVRATFDVDNGSTQNEVKFWTSDDGSTWTQLGTTVTNAGTVTMFSGTGTLWLGANDSNQTRFAGTFYRAQVLSGIGGTTVFDANFETVPADSFAFTESSTNAATVTLTTTRYQFGVPGTTLTGPNASGFSLSPNLDYYQLFTMRGKGITVRQIAFEGVTAPATNSTVYLAIYNATATGQPTGTPIYASAAITVSNAAAAIYRIRVTPFTLSAGNYVIGINGSVAFNMRVFTGGQSYIGNLLGGSLIGNYRVSRTNAVFTSSPTLWNGLTSSATGRNNIVFLGWS